MPPELVIAVGEVLTHGAAKYGPHNWRRGTEWSRYLAAAKRHLCAWETGDACDQETGYSHLAHLACCVTFLLCYEKYGVGNDDRAVQWVHTMESENETDAPWVQL